MFVVFGVWAVLAGAAQFLVALRRRARLGRQWPILAAGGVSVLLGAAFILMAATGHVAPTMIVVYAGTGGADFVIQALLPELAHLARNAGLRDHAADTRRPRRRLETTLSTRSDHVHTTGARCP